MFRRFLSIVFILALISCADDTPVVESEPQRSSSY